MEVRMGRWEEGVTLSHWPEPAGPHLLSLPPRRHRSGLKRICCGLISPRTSPPPFPGRWGDLLSGGGGGVGIRKC